MPKNVDSEALLLVNRVLGVSGTTPGASNTTLDDENIAQVLTVNDIIRRSRTVAGSSGIFRFVLRAIHAGAGDISTTVEPYNVAAIGRIAPWPRPVPRGFDLWVLGASTSEVVAGTSTSFAGMLTVLNMTQGFGVDNAGVAVVANTVQPIALWDAEGAIGGGVIGTRVGLSSFQGGPLRLPRQPGAGGPISLSFATTLDGTGTWDCTIMVGLFPEALGQDVIG